MDELFDFKVWLGKFEIRQPGRAEFPAGGGWRYFPGRGGPFLIPPAAPHVYLTGAARLVKPKPDALDNAVKLLGCLKLPPWYQQIIRHYRGKAERPDITPDEMAPFSRIVSATVSHLGMLDYATNESAPEIGTNEPIILWLHAAERIQSIFELRKHRTKQPVGDTSIGHLEVFLRPGPMAAPRSAFAQAARVRRFNITPQNW